MNKKKWTDQQFIETVKTSLSYADVIRKLGLKVAGSNYDTVKRKIKELKLDTSHMTGAAWNQGERYRPIIQAKPLKDILVKESTFVNSNSLKKRLLKENIKEHMCERCKLAQWCNNDIPLELHHINGDKHDNRIENILLLCPNCHALTNNYRGRNIGMSA